MAVQEGTRRSTANAFPLKEMEKLDQHIAVMYKDDKNVSIKEAIRRVHRSLRCGGVSPSALSEARFSLNVFLDPYESPFDPLTIGDHLDDPETFVYTDISSPAGYLRYRRQLVRQECTTRIMSGLELDLTHSYLVNGVPDSTGRLNDREVASFDENNQHAISDMPQVDLPAEMFLHIAKSIEADADLLSFRATCRLFKDLVDKTPSLRKRLSERSQSSCDEFLVGLHRDYFRKQAMQEAQQIARGHSPATRLCGFCQNRHLTTGFTDEQRARDAHARVCKGVEAATKVCAHRSLTFQEAFMMRRELYIRMAVNGSVAERLTLCAEASCDHPELLMRAHWDYPCISSNTSLNVIRTIKLLHNQTKNRPFEEPKRPSTPNNFSDPTMVYKEEKPSNLLNPSVSLNSGPPDVPKLSLQTFGLETNSNFDLDYWRCPGDRPEGKEMFIWAKANAKKALSQTDAYICPHMRSSSAHIWKEFEQELGSHSQIGRTQHWPIIIGCQECDLGLELDCIRDPLPGAAKNQFQLQLIVHECRLRLGLITDIE